MLNSKTMYFLAFEGIDSSGKSTLMKGLEQELEKQRISFITTREPGGTKLSEKLRKLLLEEAEEVPTKKAELFLYMACRAQNVSSNIAPALKEKKWVLCDRFTASSLAFQAGGRGLNENMIQTLNTYAIDEYKPHLFILVDISVEESQKRREGQQQDRFEKEEEDFHQRVRDNYLKQAQSSPEDWLVLDGRQDREVLLEKLISYLKQKNWL